MKSSSENSESTVASSNPQSIGGVEKLTVSDMEELAERLRSPLWIYPSSGDGWGNFARENLEDMRQAADLIEHQLSVIRAKDEALLAADNSLGFLGVHDENPCRLVIRKALSSHPIIGDKS